MTGLRFGPRDYHIHGTRDEAGYGMQEFRCTIRVSSARNYAYIVAAVSTKEENADRRDVADTVNTVREESDRPRPVTSAMIRVATVQGRIWHYEQRTTYKIQSTIPEEHRAAFELAHFGLSAPGFVEPPARAPESDETESSSLTPLLLLVALVSVAILIIGCRMTRFRNGTMRADPLPPT